MNPLYPQYPCLTPLTRIATRGGESILSNLFNSRWLRIKNTTLECLMASDLETMLDLLVKQGADSEESSQFIGSLIEHGFIDDGTGKVHPEKLMILPFNAYLNVTDYCNLACKHCYYGSHPGLTHGLPNVDLFRIVDRLRAGGIENLVVAGGEPMTRPGIEELLQHIHAREFREITLLTNATTLTPEQATVVAECVEVVHVSLDGPDEEMNAVIRGKGNFDNAVAGVRMLKTAGVRKVRLVTNINAVNIKCVHEMRRLCDELGVELGNNVFTEVGRGSKHHYLMPLNRDLIEFFLHETTAINCDANVSGPDYLDIHAGVSCGSGTHLISVDCRGDVFPCHLFHKSELRIGNLLTHPNLVEMLKLSPIAGQFRARTVETRKCHGCEVEHFCKGGCLAHTVAAHDSSPDPWKERDPFCEVHKTVISAQLWPG